MSTGPGAHAALPPSAAARWMSCPGSVAAAAAVPPPPSSEAAEEGTAGHALAELVLRQRVLGHDVEAEMISWADEHSARWDLGAMMHDTAPYVGFVQGVMRELDGAELALETRVRVTEHVRGTADAVVTGTDRGSGRSVVHIVDLKLGRGVRVHAERNPQLRIYALGALLDAELLAPVDLARMTIVQPRHRDGGHTSTVEMTAAELKAWGEELKAAEAAALAEGAERVPSDSACRWCPAQAVCPERIAMIAELAGLTPELAGEPTSPITMTGEQLATILPRLDGIEAWIKAVRTSALNMARLEEGAVPGWTVSLSTPRRRMTEEAASALVTLGLADVDDVLPRTPASLTAVRRLVGKEGMSAVEDLLAVGAVTEKLTPVK